VSSDKAIGEKTPTAETKPELQAWLKEKASGPDGNLWLSVFKDLDSKNHYQKGEGPIPAMMRLKQQGLLADLTIDDINKQGHAKVKQELGPHGTLGGRNVYRSSDSVLNDQELQREAAKQVEKAKEQAKLAQAERLAPSAEKIKQAMTPEIEAALKKNGFETDPEKIRKGIVEALASDTMPTEVMQKRADGDFPIMAGYMAVGAINGGDRQQILADQKQRREQWRTEHPDAAKGAEFKLYPTGDLLREKFGNDRINAADALLTKLQPPPPPPK
jgi:hypothetical protein